MEAEQGGCEVDLGEPDSAAAAQRFYSLGLGKNIRCGSKEATNYSSL